MGKDLQQGNSDRPLKRKLDKKVENFEINIDDEEYGKVNKTYEYKSRKSPQRVKLFKMVWAFMVVSVSLMFGQYFVFGFVDMLAMNRDSDKVVVEIPKKASGKVVAQILFEKGVIKNKSFFNAYINLTRATKKFVAGSFEIRTNMDYEAITSYLKSNSNRLETDLVNVMVPEGKNVMEIAAILEKSEICTQNDFLSVCASEKLVDEYDFLPKKEDSKEIVYVAEGCLFPDTYRFYKNIDATIAVKKMLSNYKKKIATTNVKDSDGTSVSIGTSAQKRGMSTRDIITIASLIQAEAADENDMYNVSSVIHNRLATSVKGGVGPGGEYTLDCLRIDSTVWYPYRSRDKVPTDMVESYESAYDTYKNKGLPPGPICNPGIVAIDAALNPNGTNYYYFCHSNDGKAFYAKNSAEHQVNLKKAGLI